MRKSADWMSIWDDRILEYIVSNGSGAPTELSKQPHIHVSKQHISRRLRELADHGLLNPLGNGVYQISKKGKHYLIGNYDAKKDIFLNDMPEFDIRSSPHDSLDTITVFDVNIDPASESEAIAMLENKLQSLDSKYTAVLFQTLGAVDESNSLESNPVKENK